jgi:putative DNA primase/helicase
MNTAQPTQVDRSMSWRDTPSYNGVHLVRAANIQPEPIRWILDGWLAVGKFHLVAGAPSTGKTTLATAIMASFSNGSTGGFGWPGKGPIARGDVIFWTSEDGIEDTVVPRLIAAGADRTRVHIVRGTMVNGQIRPFNPSDIPRLSKEIERIGTVGPDRD